LIFVTVGTAPQSFDRLIKKMDEIARKRSEEIIMQIGYSRYKPRNAYYFDFAESKVMDRLNKNARVVVCHAGVGSIIGAIKYNKPTVVIPRLRKYRENWNDHQLEIAETLAREGAIVMAREIDDLETILQNVTKKAHRYISTRERLIHFLRDYIARAHLKKGSNSSVCIKEDRH